MNIKVHSIRFDADKKLLDFVNAKISKLPTYYDDILGAEVYLRLDKDSDRENKVVEVKLEIKGSSLFAKKQCKTFEEAADQVSEALIKQLKKYKNKIRKK